MRSKCLNVQSNRTKNRQTNTKPKQIVTRLTAVVFVSIKWQSTLGENDNSEWVSEWVYACFSSIWCIESAIWYVILSCCIRGFDIRRLREFVLEIQKSFYGNCLVFVCFFVCWFCFYALISIESISWIRFWLLMCCCCCWIYCWCIADARQWQSCKWFEISCVIRASFVSHAETNHIGIVNIDE